LASFPSKYGNIVDEGKLTVSQSGPSVFLQIMIFIKMKENDGFSRNE
jgi:hypothetical protein